jgi:hypothetical protein
MSIVTSLNNPNPTNTNNMPSNSSLKNHVVTEGEALVSTN